MSQSKFLLVGADSSLGRLVGARWTAAGQPWTGTTRRESAAANLVRLDLAEPPIWNEALAGAQVAILCAAVTNTARCREHDEETARINVTHTLALAQLLRAYGVNVIFLSTNLVFDGSRPQVPRDAPVKPVSAYGRQKAAAEAGILQTGGAVVRLSKVLTSGFTLPRQWRETLRRGESVQAFSDMPCAPISGAWVAAALDALAQRFQPGIYQFSARDDLSYAGLAARMARQLNLDASLVRPVSWREAAPQLEHVPAHTTLEMGAPEMNLGFTPSDPEKTWSDWVGALAG